MYRLAERRVLQGDPVGKEIVFFVFSTKLVDAYGGVRVWLWVSHPTPFTTPGKIRFGMGFGHEKGSEFQDV